MPTVTNRHRRTAARGTLAAAALTAAVAGLGAVAQAQDPVVVPATVAISDDTLVVRGDDGVQNFNVIVGESEVRIFGATAGPGCASAGAATVCNRGGFSQLDIDSRAGDDTFTVRVDGSVVNGATVSPLPGRVLAGPGNDVVGAGVAGPTYDLGEGDDNLSVGFEPIIAIGGPGKDRFAVTDKSPGWTIRLDQVANDGPAGKVTGRIDPTFEQLAGAEKNDVLDASKVAYPVRLIGGPGDDRLIGGKSADILGVDDGADVLAGGPGRDTLNYGSVAKTGVSIKLDDKANDGRSGERDNIARDIERLGATNFPDIVNLSGSTKSGYTVATGAGSDSITDGTGPNVISAGSGNDSIKTVGDGGLGADRVSCGLGTDTLFADIDDKINGCEKVTRSNTIPR